ncbi:hypothetical protein PIB30_033532 [Stylosanthes scabra]|uniref:Secreted protein n=1 Tax=Stylosanthes scabra TaxID=79078 RepID=A0ABU6SD09_9FABA|nr:hypothetical protein [Stylosanthes scabra]
MLLFVTTATTVFVLPFRVCRAPPRPQPPSHAPSRAARRSPASLGSYFPDATVAVDTLRSRQVHRIIQVIPAVGSVCDIQRSDHAACHKFRALPFTVDLRAWFTVEILPRPRSLSFPLETTATVGSVSAADRPDRAMCCSHRDPTNPFTRQTDPLDPIRPALITLNHLARSNPLL